MLQENLVTHTISRQQHAERTGIYTHTTVDQHGFTINKPVCNKEQYQRCDIFFRALWYWPGASDRRREWELGTRGEVSHSGLVFCARRAHGRSEQPRRNPVDTNTKRKELVGERSCCFAQSCFREHVWVGEPCGSGILG